MKKISALLLLLAITSSKSISQPSYYYFSPANAGVNNTYLNPGVSYKFLFIFTQPELASTGITGPLQINSIWFKSNTASNLNIQDIKITLGHGTLTSPTDVFADNFDVGSPVVVLNEPTLLWTTLAGPWNNPPLGWSEIPLTTPFTYNFSDNLVVQCEFTNINYPIPLYADNGGASVTKYTDTIAGIIANNYTSRPMIGFSTSGASPISFGSSDSTICEKLCVDYYDFSVNNPITWEWIFEDGTPATSTDQNPAQVCYNNPGSFDVTLITTDALVENDTLIRNDFMTVYPTPSVPVITQNGNVLTSSTADFYQWQFNGVDIPGATNQSYTATVAGYYSVVIMDLAGCISQSVTVFVDATGIYEVTNVLHLVSKNLSPSELEVGLTNVNAGEEVTIRIVNELGQEVFLATDKTIGNSWTMKIDLSSPTSSVYFLAVNYAGKILVRKILISER